MNRTKLARLAVCIFGCVLFAALLPPAARGSENDDLWTASKYGDAAYARQDYAEAVKQYQRAIALALRVYGEQHAVTAALLNNLANAYEESSEFEKAESLHLRSLRILEARLGPNHPDVALNVFNLANLYKSMGQFDQALPLYQRSLKIREANYGPNHPDVAKSLVGLGIFYDELGRYIPAEDYYKRSLRILEATVGPGDPEVATTLNNLGIMYKAMGQYDKAEPIYQRCLKIYQIKLGPDHRNVADVLNNLAELYRAKKQFARAEPLYQQSLKIRETKLGPEHPVVAASLNNLTALYSDMQQYERGVPLCERSVKICEAKLGPDHPDLATPLNNLANLFRDMGQYERAEPLYRRSLKIWETKFGPDHPDVANYGLQNMAILHAAENRPDVAAEEFHRARQIVRQHVSRVLSLLSDKEQLDFLENGDSLYFHGAMTIGWQYRDQPAIAAKTAVWLANGKSVAEESLAERYKLEQQKSDPKLQPMIDRLRKTRKELADLTNRTPAAGQEKTQQAEKARLAALEDELGKQLSQAGGSTIQAHWYELDELRAGLGKQAMLVDILRFKPAIYSAKNNEPQYHPLHYVAWLTAASGDVQVVDLGECEPIDSAVAAFQVAMKPCQDPNREQNPLTNLGEAMAEAQLQQPLAALGKLIFEPIARHLQDKDEIILCPDSALWLVPWVALPVPGAPEKYALERWSIRYVTSARDLAADKREPSQNPPRIFADPDYNLKLAEVPQALDSVFGRGSSSKLSPTLLALDDRRQRSADMNFGPAPRLPGTAVEAAAIVPNLKKLCGAEPKVYAYTVALEGVFKYLAAPRVLVLSTHGFFLPDRQLNGVETDSSSADVNESKKSQSDTSFQPVENPLLRCGLLLASCNNRGQLPANSPLDDGVLTGKEIVGTNLRGTDLVVLSACQTGLGQVNNGQGVAGLRQAFQLAGAQAVVATLWQISDDQSAQLMGDFFTNLAAGQSKSESLRNAQLKMIKARREKKSAAHPFFWAAFTMTGQD